MRHDEKRGDEMTGLDRPRSVGAVVVAAGRSRRMGRDKALLPWGSDTSLERILRALEEIGAGAGAVPVRVVLREELAREEGGRTAERHGAEVVVNPDPDAEMLDSIRLGVAALPESLEAYFVWPVDHPLVGSETIGRLAGLAERGLAWIPTFGGRRGHPALVGAGAELRAGLSSLPRDAGLRELWRARAEAVRELAVEDRGVIANVDTPEQYAAALASLGLR